jgi:hypothetical protein
VSGQENGKYLFLGRDKLPYSGYLMSESLGLYYDHYKDTFDQIKGHLKKRDEAFILSIIAFASSLFTTLNPSYLFDLTTSVGKVKLGIDLNLAYYTLNSILVLVSTWFLITYYACVMTIENLYNYIHKVEERLSKSMGEFEISREGKSYLKQFPHLKTGLQFFYTVLFPVVVMFFSGIKGYWEVFKRNKAIPKGALIFDLSCLAILVALTVLYTSWIHFRDFKKEGVS